MRSWRDFWTATPTSRYFFVVSFRQQILRYIFENDISSISVICNIQHIESFQVILMVFASVGGLLAIILLLTIVLACCFANQIEKFEAEDNYYNNDNGRDEYCQQYNAQSYPPRASRPSTPSQSRRGNTGETTC